MIVSNIVGIVLFFAIFFSLFTLLPRFIMTFLHQLLSFEKKNFWKNLFAISKTHLFLGIPLTIILYQASSFGKGIFMSEGVKNNVGVLCFITVFVLLLTIRLSLLLKKRPYVKKMPFLKKLASFIPDTPSKDKLKQGYESYLFGVFFTALFLSVLILSFKILFIPSDQLINFPAVQKSSEEVSTLIGSWFINLSKYGLVFLFINFLAESALWVFGAYYES